MWLVAPESMLLPEQQSKWRSHLMYCWDYEQERPIESD
jgi:hypothetical protein